ncbi:type II toxin-antitoxin system RelE/ParE family toxin [Butyricicoccus sp. 1XD8-22]|nr:type II toxin-antitoxin system RelE/ParE family toxin [Butyricicoccus sp. 1XD8-22]
MPTKSNPVYLIPASDDMEEIAKYHILHSGVQSGRAIYSRMKTKIVRLEDFPLMGQTHPDPLLAAMGFRKLVLTDTYVTIYKVVRDTIFIYRVVNVRSDYAKLLK